MGILRTWWRKLAGRGPAPEPSARRPARPAAGQPTDTLHLADGPPRKAPPRVGAAGFDPYSSDGGYSKPHSWERVDHD